MCVCVCVCACACVCVCVCACACVCACVVCVCLCVCMCVCVCVCVMSPRWQHGGHEVAGEDSNFGGIHAEVAHFLQMEGAVRVRGTRRASDTVPHQRWVPLLSWVQPQYHQAQQIFCLVGPPLVRTTLPPHLLGSLDLAVGPVLTYSL